MIEGACADTLAFQTTASTTAKVILTIHPSLLAFAYYLYTINAERLPFV
jgi:hypothetical protein